MTAPPDKPKTFQGDLHNLPAALAPLVAKPNWVLWRWEWKKNKWDKPPYQPNGEYASSTDPRTWSTYDEVVAALDRSNGHFDGIGFMLDDSIGALDIDDCRNSENGLLDPWSDQLVGRSASYAEVTVSGGGIRIIGTVEGAKLHKKLPVANGVSCEIYRKPDGRYITVSGLPLPESAPRLANIDAPIDEVFAELSSRRGDDGPSAAESERGSASEAKTFNISPIEPDDPRFAGFGADWMELATKGTGPRGFKEKYNGDRSRAAVAFAGQCLRHGLSDDVIASTLMQWKIGDHVRDQFDVERALRRTIAKAHEYHEDSKLYAMNEKHCVLPVGGKTRVATWGDDPDFPGHKTIVMFSSLADFKALHDKYRHSYVRGGETVVVKLGAWWVGNPGRRQYDGGMKFAPTCNEDVFNGNTLNLWNGFAVAARKPEGKSGAAGCNLLLEHGRKIICSGDEEHYNYLIKREAFIVQRRTRSEIAVGLQTKKEGTGKGLWSRAFNRLLGTHAMEIQKPEHVVGKHNRHLETMLRITADEALFALSPLHRNALYNSITEPRITIEPKFIDAYPADNHLNIDIISNSDHFRPVSGSARRFFVPTVSQDKESNHEYFAAILKQLSDGGYEALLYHLLYEVDIRGFNVRAVPKTAALAEQAAYSRKGVDLLVA
jgi:hypothetical protein